MNLLNDMSFQRLQAGLQAANIRQRTIANNVANVDTPYYKSSSVSFEDMLQQQMDDSNMRTLRGVTTDPRHFAIGPNSSIPDPVITTDQSTAMNNNMNNVDVDKEMSNLAQNQLRYNAYIQQVNEQIKMMKVAVGGN
ncbi:flagellar basal body rod protein FlgB [Paenibacillus sp. JX-17]|uniref:Flagellar basal body rod protein FlgB n=1 Tax=Paenibacillus lacisoli TaxID=3064525 RepID=A0ABT9C9A2_9BACL|nr:flagellar basal body rod protein FlgB [Paenibacillus sp. JX-17]MDO7905839.1 flagellar basal body rod protein FlgB [Paenibacillus sp. JX-17]